MTQRKDNTEKKTEEGKKETKEGKGEEASKR